MKNTYILFLLMLIVVFSCKKEVPVKIVPIITNPKNNYSPIRQNLPIEYRAKLIDNKLPYPHHNPEGWVQMDYENSIENLYIINNFGLYQGRDDEKSLYFHDGLDIVLKNGTPIFAVSDGIVRKITSGNEYYRKIIVEDLSNEGHGSGYGWSYIHVNFFGVEEGDTIQQGQFLARVNFKGIEHVHLTRFKLREAGKWEEYSDLINIYPDDYFVLEDDTPPIIKKPFHFFKNQSDVFFDNGEIDTIFGDVDIVVSMRDSSAYSGSSRIWGVRFGDRLAVKKIDYRILKDGKEIKTYHSFNFGKIGLFFHDGLWLDALLVYKLRSVLEETPLAFHAYYSHYIITNVHQDMNGLLLNPGHKIEAWNTLETNDQGVFIFPNGLYEVEVSAWDGAGNVTVEVDSVYVEN